jgi:hypothetical protein
MSNPNPNPNPNPHPDADPDPDPDPNPSPNPSPDPNPSPNRWLTGRGPQVEPMRDAVALVERALVNVEKEGHLAADGMVHASQPLALALTPSPNP